MFHPFNTIMRRPFLAGLFLLASAHVMACDVCGIFLGIQPHDRSSSFGVLYRYRLRHGTLDPTTPALALKHGGMSDATEAQRYHEFYQTIELRGDLRIGQRWSLLGSVPVVNNYQSVEGLPTADLYGVGDPMLLLRYMVANTRCLTDEERTVHRLTVGGGVKLPLGRTDLTYRGADVSKDLQPGTGTWDALASVEYLVRRRSLGAGITTVGRINGTDADGYRFASMLCTSADVFYRFDGDDLTVAPSVGTYWEWAGPDAENDLEVAGTEQNTLFASVGGRIWWNAWVLSANYQHAAIDRSGPMMVPNRQRLIVGLTYNLINN